MPDDLTPKKLEELAEGARTGLRAQAEERAKYHITAPPNTTDWRETLYQDGRDTAALYVPPEPTKYNERGLPADWDYTTDRLGPDKQPLPMGATAWDKFGRPYFGDPNDTSLLGDLKAGFDLMKYEWLAPQEKMVPVTSFSKEWGEYMRSEFFTKDPFKEPELIGQAAQAGLKEVGNLFGTLMQRAQNVGEFTQERKTVLGFLGKASGLVVKNAMLPFAALSYAYKRTVKVPEVYSAIHLEEATMPELKEKYSGWKLHIANLLWGPRPGSLGVWDSVRGLDAAQKLTPEQRASDWDSAIQASRIAYSAIADPAIAAEYARRMDEGADPRLLALELENPLAEMVGETINDPDVLLGAIARTWSAKAITRRATAQWGAAADPELVRLIKETPTATGRQAADQADELLARTERMFKQADVMATENAKARGPLAPLAESKQHLAMREADDYLGILGAHYKNNPQGMLDTLEGQVRIAEGSLTGNRVMMTEGYELLRSSGLEPEFLFSEPANRNALYMRDLLIDADGNFNPKATILRDIEEAAGDIDVLIEKSGDRLQKVYDARMPSIEDQVNQQKKYLELLAEDPDVAARYLDLHPQADTKVSRGLLSLSSTHNKLQKYAYRPAYGVMGFLYMSLSPAYWFRNRLSNSFHIMVDVGMRPGLKAFFLGETDAVDKIKLMTGGMVPSGAEFGYGGPGGLTPEFGKKGFLSLSARDEMGAGRVVVQTTLEREMNKAFQPNLGIVDPTTVVKGMNRETQDLWNALVRKHWGDADKAYKELLELTETPNARHIGFLTPEQQKNMVNYRFEERLQDAIHAESLEEAHRLIDEGVDDWDDLAKLAAKESVSPDLEGASAIERRATLDSMDAVTKNLGQVEGDLHTRQVHANRTYYRLSNEAINGTDGIAMLAMHQHQAKVQKTLLEAIEAVRVNDLPKAKAILGDAPVQWDDFIEIAGRADTNEIIDMSAKIAYSEAKVGSKPFEIAAEQLWDDTFAEADAFVESRWRITRAARRKGADLKALWMEAGFVDEAGVGVSPPEKLHKNHLLNKLWKEYREIQRQRFVSTRERLVIIRSQNAVYWEGLGDVSAETPLMRRADEALNTARLMDDAKMARDGTLYVERAVEVPEADLFKVVADQEAVAAKRGLRAVYNAPLEGETGISGWGTDSYGEALTRAGGDPKKVNVAYVTEEQYRAGRAAAIAEDVARGSEVVEEAYQYTKFDEGVEWKGVSELAEPKMERIPVVAPDDNITKSAARMAHESKAGVGAFATEVKEAFGKNWDGMPPPEVPASARRQFRELIKQQNAKTTTVRGVAVEVANGARDFTLHDYGKRFGIDLPLGYAYPYQFWYSRTYLKWIKRAWLHPELIAAYSRYRRTMEKLHAGLPDWWKYQINSNELLGIDAENPIFFNLESTINPLNGITGVDFNDPRKRVDWVSAYMDDLGKFGPSVWTQYNLGLALAYQIQGKEEAASRWGGRLFTGTRTFRDVTSMLGMKEGRGFEVDPMIWMFSDGMGPYDRRRVGRHLGEMDGENVYSSEAIQEAGYLQEGQIWDEATARMVQERNLGNTFGWIAGTGFKPRSQTDIQIDRMYSDIYSLINQKPNLAPQEYQRMWDELDAKYPFMDTVLLARKGDLERDEAYAWNVLGRLPPGLSDDIIKAAGLDYSTVSDFYDNKGNLSKLTKSERMRFMATILDMGLILEIPSDATRYEWRAAKNSFSEMMEMGKDIWGDDIWDRTDNYFATVNEFEDRSHADAILEADPNISQALDWKAVQLVFDPNMGPYYGGLAKIESYYKGLMYDEVERELGDDIWDKWREYWRRKDMGEDAKAYWKENPELEEYTEIREDWEGVIAFHVAEFGSKLPEIEPAKVREDFEPFVPVQERIAEFVRASGQPQMPQWTQQDWAREVGGPVVNLVNDIALGDSLPSVAKTALERAAERLEMPGGWQTVVGLIQRSGLPQQALVSQQPTPQASATQVFGSQFIEQAKAEANKQQGFLSKDTLGKAVDIGGAKGLQEDETVDLLYEVTGARQPGPPTSPYAGFVPSQYKPREPEAPRGERTSIFSETTALEVSLGYGTGFTREYRDLIEKFGVDVALEGGGYAHMGRGTYIHPESPLRDPYTRDVLRHELGHQAMDEANVGIEKFNGAIKRLIKSDSKDDMVPLIEEFYTGTQGYYTDSPDPEIPAAQETYAQIFVFAEGDLEEVPSSLRKYYKRWME